MGLDVPKRVRRVLCALRGAGFDVFPVGGCVRDLVMGRRPQDWDAATSASPAEIAAIFPGAVIKDGRLGAVLVPAGSGGGEVTAFRREGRYTDGRRPDDVELRENIAMVSAVGRKMSSRPGISGRLFKALGDEGINIRTIAQGADELAITVGVENEQYEKAIRVLYDSFAG